MCVGRGGMVGRLGRVPAWRAERARCQGLHKERAVSSHVVRCQSVEREGLARGGSVGPIVKVQGLGSGRCQRQCGASRLLSSGLQAVSNAIVAMASGLALGLGAVSAVWQCQIECGGVGSCRERCADEAETRLACS